MPVDTDGDPVAHSKRYVGDDEVPSETGVATVGLFVVTVVSTDAVDVVGLGVAHSDRRVGDDVVAVVAVGLFVVTEVVAAVGIAVGIKVGMKVGVFVGSSLEGGAEGGEGLE